MERRLGSRAPTLGPWGVGTLGLWVSLGLVSCSRRHQPDRLEHLPGGFTSLRLFGRREATPPWSEGLLGRLPCPTFRSPLFTFWVSCFSNMILSRVGFGSALIPLPKVPELLPAHRRPEAVLRTWESRDQEAGALGSPLVSPTSSTWPGTCRAPGGRGRPSEGQVPGKAGHHCDGEPDSGSQPHRGPSLQAQASPGSFLLFFPVHFCAFEKPPLMVGFHLALQVTPLGISSQLTFQVWTFLADVGPHSLIPHLWGDWFKSRGSSPLYRIA